MMPIEIAPSQAALAHRERVCRDLIKAGWLAAVLSDGVVVLYHNAVWQVVGGDATSPSMKRRPEIDPRHIRWTGP